MSDQCNDDVFKYGESVGLFDMTKEEANAKCAEMTEKSEFTYDWHFAMGRVHVKRLRKGFVKEDRYFVIKRKDLNAIQVTDAEAEALSSINRKIEAHRAAQGKAALSGVFIESDWNCYDDAWKLVRKEWGDKQENAA